MRESQSVKVIRGRITLRFNSGTAYFSKMDETAISFCNGKNREKAYAIVSSAFMDSESVRR